MPFPPQQPQPGEQPQTQMVQKKPAKPGAGDGKVEGYDRIVNGKVVRVNGYGGKPSASTAAAAAVRLLPGRPRMSAKPGTYASGRDLPGVIAKRPAPEPMPVFGNPKEQKNVPPR